MSQKPKLIVNNDVDLSGFTKVSGVLESFYETGMECLGLILYDDSVQGPPNPLFNPDLPVSEENFEFYKVHEGMHFLKAGCILEVNGVRYLLARDIEFAKEDKHRFSFYPQGFSRNEIIELFKPENVRAILWEPIKFKK